MAKQKAMGQRAALSLSKNFYGPEPEIGSDLSQKLALIRAFNWYNNFYDHEKGTFANRDCNWLEEYLTSIKKMSNKDVAAVKRSGLLRQVDVVKCQLIMRECKLPEGSVEDLHSRIDEALSLGRMKTVQMFGDRIGPAERNKRKALNFRGDIDRIYDLIWDGKIKPAQIQYIETYKKLGIKAAQAGLLASWYKEVLQEEQLDDPEVKRSKKNAKARLTFLKELVTTLELWAKGKEDKPEPKVKKPVIIKKIGKKTFKSTRPVATAANIKFKKVDEESKLTSINPKQILGAQLLVVYNAKYKQLAILRAANAEGLSVKGTTILNVDEKTSEAKRAGRHLTSIREMAAAPKTKIAKLFKSIDSASIPVRTRTSEDIILVRAIK